MKKIITKQQSNSISFAGLLFILFLGLKLAGIGEVATWSWWWVTSPLWIGAAIAIGIAITVLLFVILGSTFIALGKFISKNLKTEPKGYLNISSVPTSKIVLDGKVLGDTPKVKVKVTPGAHQILLIDNKGTKFEKSVLVVDGEIVSVSHKF